MSDLRIKTTFPVPLHELERRVYYCFYCGTPLSVHVSQLTARCSNQLECGLTFRALREGELVYHVLYRLENPNSVVFSLWLRDYFSKHQNLSRQESEDDQFDQEP